MKSSITVERNCTVYTISSIGQWHSCSIYLAICWCRIHTSCCNKGWWPCDQYSTVFSFRISLQIWTLVYWIVYHQCMFRLTFTCWNGQIPLSISHTCDVSISNKKMFKATSENNYCSSGTYVIGTDTNIFKNCWICKACWKRAPGYKNRLNLNV